MGALAVVALVERDYGRSTLILDYAGLATRRPAAAAAMLVFLLSLGEGIRRWPGSSASGWCSRDPRGRPRLACRRRGPLSVLGFYYYLRIVLQMYLRPARAEGGALEVAAGPWVLVGATAVASVVLGILPYALLRLL